VRRPPEMEHPNLVTLPDRAAWPDRDLARRHLCHPHGDEAHQADARVVGLDEDQGASGHCGDEGLREIGGSGVWPVGIYESHSGRLGVVSTRDQDGLHDLAIDGTVPAVIVGGAEESLINGPADELGGEGVIVEHMVERVRLSLQPKTVQRFHVVGDAVDGRFAGAVDDAIVVGKCDRAHARTEESGEEVVPRGESMIRSVWVADVGLVEIRHGCARSGPKPAIVLGSEHVA